MKILTPTLLAILLFTACKSEPNTNITDYSNVPVKTAENLKITRLKLDSIELNAEYTSMEGTFIISNHRIVFGDEVFSTVCIYDEQGKFIERKLKRGKGPNEVLGINQISSSSSSKFYIMDQSWNIYSFSKEWERTESGRLKWSSKKSRSELLNNPLPQDLGIYEVEYAKNDLKVIDDEYLIFPIITEHPKLNSYSDARKFYKETYTLGVATIKSGEVEDMIISRPPIFLQYKYIPNFKFINFEVINQDIYYSFEPDSLIYVYDFYKKKLKYAFGIKGKAMEQNYQETQTIKSADNTYYKHRKKYGYYDYLQFEEKTGVLFRGYKKGNKSLYDGLQIYDNNTLIGDVDVPKNFKVIGYIYQWYYALGKIDETNEKFTLYKFKL